MAHGGDFRDSGSARDGGPDLGRDRVKAALGGHDVVGLDRVLVRASPAARKPLTIVATSVTSASPIISAAAVVAVRVVLRVELPLASRPAGRRSAARGRPRSRERPDDATGDHDHAEEQRQGAEADEDHRPAHRAAAERAGQAQRGRDARIVIGMDGLRAPSRGGRVAPSRMAAIGAIRVARRAGEMLAIRVTIMPSQSATMTVRGSDDRRGLGQVDAERLEQPVQALREREAEHQADDGREHAHRQSLGQHRALDLPS